MSVPALEVRAGEVWEVRFGFPLNGFVWRPILVIAVRPEEDVVDYVLLEDAAVIGSMWLPDETSSSRKRIV